MSIKTFKLNNGVEMPSIGVGTYRMTSSQELETCLATASKHSPLLIDTAQVYGNETTIGSLFIKTSFFGLPRSDIFITSKLSPYNQGYENCLNAVKSSLQNLKCDYIDLYLIHWPGSSGVKHDSSKNIENRLQSWKALEKMYKDGVLKAIGVSNFTNSQLKHLIKNCEIKPSVLQIELHPLYYPEDVIKTCKEHNIQITSYSSFGEGSLIKEHRYRRYFEDNDSIRFNKNYSVGEILLGWCLHHSFAVIPKSLKKQHIEANMRANNIVLSKEEMEYLDSLHSSLNV